MGGLGCEGEGIRGCIEVRGIRWGVRGVRYL